MNLVLLAGSIVITGLVFLWLVRVIKATLKTALLVAAIVFGLQFFGIGSDRILSEVQQILRSIWRMIPGKQEISDLNFENIVHQVKHAALNLMS